MLYVVVLNWNQWQFTSACVHSLLKAQSTSMHIIVVDNGSQDDSVAQLTNEFGSQITLIPNGTNLGYAGGNNVGIQYAIDHNASHIMILNNDTVVTENFLQPLLSRLESSPKIGAVAPKIYFMEPANMLWGVGGQINWLLGKAKNLGGRQIDTGQFNHSRQLDYVTGCCFLAHSELFSSIGMFNERFFAYFEDTDWSMRVREQGRELWYEPNSVIYHWGGASGKKKIKGKTGQTSPFLYYLSARNNLWFLRLHAKGLYQPISIFMFLIQYVLFYSAVFILLCRWAKLQHLWRGVMDGFQDVDTDQDTIQNIVATPNSAP